MNVIEIAAGMLAEKLGLGEETTVTGLQQLFGDASGNLDFGAIVSLLQQRGFGDILSSWLGDGANSPIDETSLENLLGQEKVSEAASQMGIETGALLGGLKDVLPQLIDQASSGGNLLDAIGNIGGLGDFTKKLF